MFIQLEVVIPPHNLGAEATILLLWELLLGFDSRNFRTAGEISCNFVGAVVAEVVVNAHRVLSNLDSVWKGLEAAVDELLLCTSRWSRSFIMGEMDQIGKPCIPSFRDTRRVNVTDKCAPAADRFNGRRREGGATELGWGILILVFVIIFASVGGKGYGEVEVEWLETSVRRGKGRKNVHPKSARPASHTDLWVSASASAFGVVFADVPMLLDVPLGNKEESVEKGWRGTLALRRRQFALTYSSIQTGTSLKELEVSRASNGHS
ncbi:hypothetical protein BKA70DRAFT_1403040 [Coprinopsis sp. MPI-PUGE-AT-0042]|nr:hypothetical protein BKA70DRAFT_1403040 [Coprinopsis sp. MPI-PUGE-AT-0042]